nr:MAG TPA: hypothetical protein [Caudoviricetes sp.]
MISDKLYFFILYYLRHFVMFLLCNCGHPCYALIVLLWSP